MISAKSSVGFHLPRSLVATKLFGLPFLLRRYELAIDRGIDFTFGFGVVIGVGGIGVTGIGGDCVTAGDVGVKSECVDVVLMRVG